MPTDERPDDPREISSESDSLQENAQQSEPTESIAADADIDQAETLSPEEEAEARRYRIASLRWTLIDKSVDLIYLGSVALLAGALLHSWSQSIPMIGSTWTGQIIGVFLFVTIGHIVVSFPISYCGGFKLEHRFGLSTLRFWKWFLRYLAGLAIMAVCVMGALIVGLFWIIRLTGDWWWPIAALGFYGVAIFLSWVLPVVVMPLFYQIEPLDRPELFDRLCRLAKRGKLTLEGVYRWGLSVETVKANAAVVGLGTTRRVLLSDTLLEKFSDAEIGIVFAHEVGHHVKKHMKKMLIGSLATSLLSFWLLHLVLGWQMGSDTEIASVSPAMVPMILFVLTLFSLFGEPIFYAFSRRNERQADRYALEETDDPDAFRSAFRRLARQNKDDPNPPWLEVVLMYSHPPISQRIVQADRYESESSKTREDGESES